MIIRAVEFNIVFQVLAECVTLSQYPNHPQNFRKKEPNDLVLFSYPEPSQTF